MANQLLFANNANSTLAGAINNTATSLQLAAGGGALFPNPGAGQYFVMTLTDAATGLVREIIWCTARSGDVCTIVRGQEGTTAENWLSGDLIANFWTAGQAAAMSQSGVRQNQPARIVVASADPGMTLQDYAIGFNRAAGLAATPCALPNGMQQGDSFLIQDLAGNFFNYPVTVAFPGSIKWAGKANFVCNKDFGTYIFTYYGSNVIGVAQS